MNPKKFERYKLRLPFYKFMRLFRLEKYAKGDGDPIDTSDAIAILSEVEASKREAYNKGIDAAIEIVTDACDYDLHMIGFMDSLVCTLENSKKK